MKIKLKLTLGVGLLFLLIIVLTTVSAWYINALKQDTNNILAANYNTLEYSRNMILALDEIKTSETAIAVFEDNLRKQQNNITEPKEKEATDKVAKHFTQLKKNPGNSSIESLIRKAISDLMKLNMSAIKTKSKLASNTAETATVWIGITGTLCFVIAFVLLVNLPGSIANPITELTESIKQIAAKNYHQRVHFKSHGEFGELAKSFNIMAQKLEEYAGSNVAQLLMEKKRIETLINNMHDPVIGLNENGKVLFANDEMLKITGLRKENTIGKTIASLSESNDLIRTLLQDINQEVSQRGKPSALKIYADNKESYFEKELVGISIVPTGETESIQIGRVIILKNVTSFKELDSAKTNFIASVSHEFKTPISSIKMGLQLLENKKIGQLNDEQKNLLDGINDDTDRLLKITGELLNLTQIESGNIQLAIVPADPKEILIYAINATRVQADQKNIHFEIAYPNKLPKILADSEKTAWVLTNLISNGIRYSPDGSIIKISIKKQGTKLKFCVQDQGPGIAPQYIDRIFERYFRIPGTQKEGTGLGLAISKEFIKAQNGEIWVKSEYGLGSTFTVTLQTNNSDEVV